MKIAGIYLILNTINNKVYIGSSINIESRWYEHKWKLNKNRHGSKHLQATWNKYGKENFEFKIIEEILDKTKLIEREQYWLDFYKSYDREKGYNTREKAEANYGLSPSVKTRKKISDGNKGKIVSKETCKKISQALTGKIRTEESKQKQSQTLTGRKLPESHRLNLLGHKAWNIGLTKETSEGVKRISESKMGNKNPQFGKLAWNSGIAKIIVVCQNCLIKFSTKRWRHRKFCSKRCANIFHKPKRESF